MIGVVNMIGASPITTIRGVDFASLVQDVRSEWLWGHCDFTHI